MHDGKYSVSWSTPISAVLNELRTESIPDVEIIEAPPLLGFALVHPVIRRHSDIIDRLCSISGAPRLPFVIPFLPF